MFEGKNIILVSQHIQSIPILKMELNALFNFYCSVNVCMQKKMCGCHFSFYVLHYSQELLTTPNMPLL